jgi:hypothetical protein
MPTFLVEPYRDHRLQGFLLRVFVFRCCVNNLYLFVVTEAFLYLLPTNRCLCHNLGDVFQQAVTYQWIYMSQYCDVLCH